MKVYVVMFSEEYEGYDCNRNCKVFKDGAEAKKYVEKLNKELAEKEDCDIEDLGDYYVCIGMDMV